MKLKDKELIISLIIGDGSLYRNNSSYELYVGHGEKQKDYMEWKLNLFNSLDEFSNAQSKSKIIRNKNTNKEYLQYYFKKTSKNFCDIYNEISQNNEKTINDYIGILKSNRSLAIWFMDDGSVFKVKRKHKDGSIYYLKPTLKLCTHCFTKEENERILSWLQNKYRINGRMASETKRNRPDCPKYYYLAFDSENSKKIYDNIKQYIMEIESMKEKFKYFIEYYN